MRLDIDSLRAFKTVLEAGGVTRAAERLNLTQSAVSHKLARLEERIGRPILVKGPGGFAPTEDGHNLLSYAERLVALHDEAAEHFSSSELAGTVRLGAIESVTGQKLAALLGRFRRLHPQAALNIRIGQSLTLRRWLEAGELDMAIVQLFEEDKRPGDRELWRDDLIWAGAQDHPMTLGRTIPFVSFDENCFYRLAARRTLAGSGRSLEVVLECPSADGVRAGVRHGLGVALMSRRTMGQGLVEITEGLPALPPVCHVLRRRPGADGELMRHLEEAVAQEMADAR